MYSYPGYQEQLTVPSMNSLPIYIIAATSTIGV